MSILTQKHAKGRLSPRLAATFCCVLPAVLGTLGCTSEVMNTPDSGEDGPQSVATTQEAASACLAKAYAVPGQYNIREDQICFATNIPNIAQGNYDIDLVISHANGYWYATGQGEMRCVPQSCFYSDGGSQDQALLSPMFQTTAVAKAGQGTVTSITGMWLADAMAFMSTYHFSSSWGYQAGWLDGDNFNPSGTHVLVSTANGSTGGRGPADAVVGTLGYSFFFGIPHSGHQVRGAFYSRNGKMIPTSSGICAISAFDLMSPGRLIRVYAKDNYWNLEMSAGMSGGATCYLFDQSQFD